MRQHLLGLMACSALVACASGGGGGPSARLITPEIAPSVAPAAKMDARFDAKRMQSDVQTLVGMSQKMAKTNQMFGRISGFPSETEAANWAADEFRGAGLINVTVQTYAGSADFWWPDAWTADVVSGGATRRLASAVPASRSEVSGEGINAPIMFVGEAGAVTLDNVAGKIAIQHTQPATGAYSDRARIRDSSIDLVKAGAAGVLNWVEQSGNMMIYDFGGCGGACFNIGGDLKALAEKAQASGAAAPHVRLSLKASVKKDLKAQNIFGMLPGTSPEIVIVNAHLDAWFDGAGDNADGVAVMLALARHYGGADAKPARTLMFVGSGGHHSTGLNGPGNLVAMNAELMKRVVAVINLEHLAQYRIEAVPAWKANADEEPKTFGVSNTFPFVIQAVKAAAAKNSFALKGDVTDSVPGDLGGYRPLNVALMQGIHSGPLYHTSGDGSDSISSPGLVKAAAFYADLIDAMLKADVKQINP
jgi:hypothetical protein